MRNFIKNFRFGKLNKQLQNNRGMTLMEIMIVLAIIGGLIAVLLPNITSQLNRSRVKQTRITISQITQAITGYQIDCGKFPTTLEALTKAPADCPNWGPDPYMKSIPKDGFGQSFTLDVKGPDTPPIVISPGYKGKEITSEDLQ